MPVQSIVPLSLAASTPSPQPATGLAAQQLRNEFGSLLVGLRLDLAWLDQRLAEQAGSSEDTVHTLRMEMRMRCDEMGEQIDRAMQGLERMVYEQGGDSVQDGVER